LEEKEKRVQSAVLLARPKKDRFSEEISKNAHPTTEEVLADLTSKGFSQLLGKADINLDTPEKQKNY